MAKLHFSVHHALRPDQETIRLQRALTRSLLESRHIRIKDLEWRWNQCYFIIAVRYKFLWVTLKGCMDVRLWRVEIECRISSLLNVIFGTSLRAAIENAFVQELSE